MNTDHGWSGTPLLFCKEGSTRPAAFTLLVQLTESERMWQCLLILSMPCFPKWMRGLRRTCLTAHSRNVVHKTALDEDLAYVLTVNPHSGDEMRFGRNTKRGGRKKTGKVRKKTKRDFTVSNSNYVRFKQAASTLSQEGQYVGDGDLWKELAAISFDGDNLGRR